MIALRGIVVAALCLATAPSAWAQSLADVARQEAARRDAAKPAVKAYTNADLKVDPWAPPAGVAGPAEEEAGGYMSISAGRLVSAEELIRNSVTVRVTGEQAAQEPDWRRQAEVLRGQLIKAQQDAAAMSETANDESRSAGERAVAAQLLAQSQVVVGDLERRWLRLDEQAAKLRIPREWLEPRPALSTKTPR